MRPLSLSSLLIVPLLTGCPFDPEPTPIETDTDGTTGGTMGSDDVVPDGTTTTTDPGTDTDPPMVTTGDPGMLVSIRVEPPNAVLELDLDTPGNFEFTVLGTFDDGTEMEVSDIVEDWTVSNEEVGMMNGNALDVPAFADSFFASTVVTATIGELEGQAQLTVAAYRQTGEQQDFFFVLPFADPEGPQEKPLTFSTDVKALDVFINMDTTGSMGSPIQNLQTSLTGTVIAGIAAQIPDTLFGAGVFEDFPVMPFGEESCFNDMGAPDQPFTLFTEMTDLAMDVQDAVNSMSNGFSPVGCGADGPESQFEALYQIATGEGLMGPGLTMVEPNMNGIGGVAFRDGAMPVIVSITDAVSNQNAPGGTCVTTPYSSNPAVSAVAHTGQEAIDALNGICARVVPVVVSNFNETCGPLPDGEFLAESTGTMIPPDAWDLAPGGRPPGCAPDQCCTGIGGAGVPPNGDGQCPLVYRVNFDGTGLDLSVVDGVQNMAAYSPFDVTTEVTGTTEDSGGLPLPPGTTTADFIISVTPLEHGPVPLPGAPDPTLTDDSFLGVIPNTPVTFTVEAFNSFLPQGPEARLFIAEIAVVADGCSELDTREVFILVPPAELDPAG